MLTIKILFTIIRLKKKTEKSKIIKIILIIIMMMIINQVKSVS